MTLVAATGRFSVAFWWKQSPRARSLYVQWDSWVDDHPPCLEPECSSHCWPWTHFPLPIPDVLLQPFEDPPNYNRNLGSFFQKVSFGLSTVTWEMVICCRVSLPFWTFCTLSNPGPQLFHMKSRSPVSSCAKNFFPSDFGRHPEIRDHTVYLVSPKAQCTSHIQCLNSVCQTSSTFHEQQ